MTGSILYMAPEVSRPCQTRRRAPASALPERRAAAWHRGPSGARCREAQVLRGDPCYAEGVDVFSAAVCMWSMAAGREAYSEDPGPLSSKCLRAARAVAEGARRPPLWAVGDRSVEALLERMWAQDPARRPEAGEAASVFHYLRSARARAPPRPAPPPRAHLMRRARSSEGALDWGLEQTAQKSAEGSDATKFLRRRRGCFGAMLGRREVAREPPPRLLRLHCGRCRGRPGRRNTTRRRARAGAPGLARAAEHQSAELALGTAPPPAPGRPWGAGSAACASAGGQSRVRGRLSGVRARARRPAARLLRGCSTTMRRPPASRHAPPRLPRLPRLPAAAPPRALTQALAGPGAGAPLWQPRPRAHERERVASRELSERGPASALLG